MTQSWTIPCIGTWEYIDTTLTGGLGDILVPVTPAYVAPYLWRDPRLLGYTGRWANEPLICPGEWDCGTRPQELHNSQPGSPPARCLFDIVQAGYAHVSCRYRYNGNDRLQPAGSILLNKTTMEYVRGDILPYGISLGHVVLMRICWSSYPDVGIKNGNYLSKGAWAGHRFRSSKRAYKTGWTDVGRTVLREIARIWETLLGEDCQWRVNDAWLPDPCL